MNENDIYQKLTEIFRELFDDPQIELTPQTCADDIDEWDSFEQINLLLTIEKQFGIKFSMEEASSMQNVGQIVKVIQTHC